MKTNKILVLATLSLTLFSCDDWMNTEPAGGTKTTDQVADASQLNPSAADGTVNSMYAQMIDVFTNSEVWNQDRHNDFGMPAICLFLSEQGQDCWAPNSGYNWFGYSLYPNNRDNSLQTTEGFVDHLIWNDFYKLIYCANQLIGTIDENEPGAQEQNLGQALALRAFAYFQLAQLYAKTYQSANLETEPCVPLVLPNMAAEKQLNNPRASLKEVFEVIDHDINWACEHLSTSRVDKAHINSAVAFGIRARINLVKGNFAAAAEDASKALELSGAQILSYNECLVPGFADAEAKNVVWANIIVETNDCVQTGICNWPSFMCTFFTDGYTSVGTYLSISTGLYNEIAEGDVRKNWWLNEENGTGMKLNEGFKSVLDGYAAKDKLYPCINVKFGTGDGIATSGDAAAAGDWILMRAEELLLIKAEAEIRAGQSASATLAPFFAQRYKGEAPAATLDQVLLERRIELWAEGFEYFDILRNHVSIKRNYAGSNWPAAWIQDLPADDDLLRWRIPEAEIQANQGISDAQK